MGKTEADDAEFQKLVEHHKADIQASNMTRDELIDLLARNLASYHLLHSLYEEGLKSQAESIHYQEAIIKATEQSCELLKKQNSDTERKQLAAANAIPRAIKAGMEAGVGIGIEEEKKTVKQQASKRAKAAADALHDQPGGTREKQDAIRAIWATGKYKSRDLCAEQEWEALDMSFSAARKALRNTPNPA